jgi:hypothetical protein
MKKNLVLIALAIGMLFAPKPICAEMISEFEPNPAGADPANSTFELFGTAGAAFDYNIISVENDGFNGIVDRAANVTGTFDANGLAIVDVPDLENPSFTVFLTEFFVATGTDLDAANDGTLDVTGFGTIFDMVGVSDSVGDDSSLYSTILGGSSILYNGFGEPLGVFRDGSTGDWFQFVNTGTEIELFAANGGPALDVSDFSSDPTTTTFGAINPTLAVPEPSTLAFASLIGMGIGLVRRRK